MAIKSKVCPNCESKNVIDIIYGYPNLEIVTMAEEGKLKLGGCCISLANPEFHCKNCASEWNREEAIDAAYHRIKGIKALVGGYFEGYYEVYIDFNTRELTWEHCLSNDVLHQRLHASTIVKIKEQLKLIFLLDWKAKYVDTNI